MIGVISRPEQSAVVEEFFQLFKTPWEFHQPGRAYDVVVSTTGDAPEVDASLLLVSSPVIARSDVAAGIRLGETVSGQSVEHSGVRLPVYTTVCSLSADGGATLLQAGHRVVGLKMAAGNRTQVRLGYDLFAEIEHLLRVGQPPENAGVPALDRHVELLRGWMLEAGIAFVEIPPVPAGKDFMVSLTHDIDFIGIRRHMFDHTMFGFLFRSTIGALKDVARGKIPVSRLFRIWAAVLKLPFVYLGFAKDFWLPFPWLMEVEKNLPATYYFIPFKGRAGEKLTGKGSSRRACAYDITDIPQWTKALLETGCEFGVHGIDSWHDAVKGREEIARVTTVTGSRTPGIRMHWLMWSEDSYRMLEEAGYSYDSTAGYNEAVGFRNGTAQVFRPLGRRELLELPMHIQDGALFYPGRMDLSESAAWERCEELIGKVGKAGGVLTLLWHDRSHGPERFWGEFYARLVGKLRGMNVWFGSGRQVVDWFRLRRSVTFLGTTGMSGLELSVPSAGELPPLTVRVHARDASGCMQSSDAAWTGGRVLKLSDTFPNLLLTGASASVACA